MIKINDRPISISPKIKPAIARPLLRLLPLKPTIPALMAHMPARIPVHKKTEAGIPIIPKTKAPIAAPFSALGG